MNGVIVKGPRKPPMKIVIKPRPATKGDNGNTVYMARLRAEREERRVLCNLIVKWGRGFSIEDAPPLINEWTRARRL